MIPNEPGEYFSLNADCFLVKGALRGALYNLANGDVYSIDPVSIRVLEGCDRGEPVARVLDDVREAPADEILGYLRRIEEAGMGRFHGPAAVPAKVDLHSPCMRLDFMWFELREDCNLRCRHCYCMSAPKTGITERLAFEDWMRLLDEGADLGCRAMQFIGGEPFLYGPRLFDLAARAAALGYESIGVFSNLTFLKEEWIDRLLEFRMNVSYSLYSKRPEIHDLVTGKRGSFDRTMANVRRLRERGVTARPCVTVMKQNQDFVDETMEFLRELGVESPSFDLVRPAGRGGDEEILPDKFSGRRSFGNRGEFMQTDRTTFIRRANGNSCWQGKMAIGSTGDVHPCIMQRDGASGNVRSQSLKEIIAGGIRRYWDLSFDKIEVCRDCEYRYACHDCRPITYGPSGELTAKSIHCSYDPYRGVFTDAA
jgi:radical SAM protein with 4Fe4S-binding SPASM domain